MLTRDDLATLYCHGNGVELGPGLRPTRAGPNTSIAFVDKRSPDELKAYFGSTEVVTGQRLDAFERASFDFLIAHHVLEHCSNVVEELIFWMEHLKDKSVLFLSVPNKQHCPDVLRLETPPSHFIFDYLTGIDDSSFESREHIHSFLWGWAEHGALAGKTKCEAASLVFNAVQSPTNDLHWHVFTAATLQFVIETAARLCGRTVTILHADDGHPAVPEHRIVVLLEKTQLSDTTVTRLRALKDEVASLVLGFCLDGLEGKPLYSLSEIDKGKIFIAEGGQARWVREPKTLVDRAIDAVPAIYVEFGRARDRIVGPDLASTTFNGRREVVHHRIRLADGIGLEISPGDAPLVRKSEGCVTYCDKFDADFWRTSYGSSNNVGVDVVTHGRPIDEVFAWGSFDYVVSSHVLEHVPDFIGHFLAVERILRPGGDAVLLVPDKRYTFDLMRTPSTVDQIDRAHIAKLAHPSMEMLRDFYGNVDHRANAAALWAGEYTPSPQFSSNEVASILASIKVEECDTHCWVFTPRSIKVLLEHVCRNFVSSLHLIEVSDTPTGCNEFLVHLRKS